MASIRDIKRRARQTLHDTMSVRALYLVPASPGEYDATPVTVRVHTTFKALGDLQGTSFHYAEKQDETPKIIFMRSELAAPQRGAIVSVEPGEAYKIDNVLPADDITVTAEVIRIPVAGTNGLPVPEADE